MPSPWRSNPETRVRVRDLLIQSGASLEARVAALSADFVKRRSHHEQINVSSERVIYGDSKDEESLREVDRVLQFYTELEVEAEPQLGVQFQMVIPIECKRRQGIELFGFPYQDPSGVGPVLVSDLGASDLVRE